MVQLGVPRIPAHRLFAAVAVGGRAAAAEGDCVDAGQASRNLHILL
jgi:hypothetical protein